MDYPIDVFERTIGDARAVNPKIEFPKDLQFSDVEEKANWLKLQKKARRLGARELLEAT